MKILNRSDSKAFTLIELLVVVAIIAILASIAVPVISKALENAKKAQARTEIRTIETAIRAYYNEYSMYPEGSGKPDKTYITGNSDLISTLRAQKDGANNNHVLNRKQIVFMEVSEGSLDEDNNFVDPWQQPYRIAIDTDFNNEVAAGSPYGTIVNRQVAVWSLGPGGDATKTNDHLKSWR